MKPEYLPHQSQQGVPEILKLIPDATAQNFRKQRLIVRLTASRFIGCGEAESNLSIQCKLDFAESLEEKYSGQKD